MVSCFNLDTVIPKVKSKTKHYYHSAIDLNLNPIDDTRRTSFLPLSLQQENVKRENRGFVPFKNNKNVYKYKNFCTGSCYIGHFNNLGMTGKGIYKFPHGVIYDGHFNKNGEFHGSGTLNYPGGQRIEGIWKNGKILQTVNFPSSGISPFSNQYCKGPDRRFQIEVENELAPANEEYLTNRPNPPRKIKEGCYDTEEGFYDPKLRVIWDYEDPTAYKSLTDYGKRKIGTYLAAFNLIANQQKINPENDILSKLQQRKGGRLFSGKRIEECPVKIKEEWIKQNCRKAWDEAVGYHQNLYEIWTSGLKAEENISSFFNDVNEAANEALIKSFIPLPLPSENQNTMHSFILTSGILLEEEEKGYNEMTCIKTQANKSAYYHKSHSLRELSMMLLPKINLKGSINASKKQKRTTSSIKKSFLKEYKESLKSSKGYVKKSSNPHSSSYGSTNFYQATEMAKSKPKLYITRQSRTASEIL